MTTKKTTTRRKKAETPTTIVMRCVAIVTSKGHSMVTGHYGGKTETWASVKEAAIRDAHECDFLGYRDAITDVVLFEVELPLPKEQDMKPRFKVTIEDSGV